MGLDENTPVERAIIVLQGGGRLEGVAEILDVRLEADPLRCDFDGPGRLLAKGGVRAYVYCRSARGRDVAGQGFYIPFSSRINVGSIPAQHAHVSLGELRSDHSFDPITGDFQHQITVELLAFDRRSESPAGQPQGAGRVEASPVAQGEVRLSQVRSGVLPDEERRSGVEEPVASRAPTPEEQRMLSGPATGSRAQREGDLERESKAGDVEEALADKGNADANRGKADADSEKADTGGEKADADSEKAAADRNTEAVPGPGAAKSQGAPAPPRKKGGPIVWGPFPPPIR